MSEYWVSRDKYFCRYCNIYIADDKPSRAHHDNGFRHKGNYERYIHNIYKKGAKIEKDKKEEAAEIARIEAAANAAMAADGLPSTSAAPPPPPPKSKGAATPSTDPFANYSTAQSLGFVDEDAKIREADQAEKEQKQQEGRIGEWKRVVKPPPPPPRPTGAEGGDGASAEPEEVPRERPKKAIFSEKIRQLDDDDLYDPAKLDFKLKRKRLTLQEQEEIRIKEEAARKEKERAERKERKKAGMTKSGWAEAEVKEEEMLQFEPLPGEVKEEDVKEEEKPSLVSTADSKPDVKPAGPVFKKRKGNAAMRTK
ncbi:hypothetical protein T439DRAFT_377031 [Meredithblackwellia eburnea MCA 4105]